MVEKKEGKECKCNSGFRGNNVSSGVYCLGLVGAAIYYIQTATNFWDSIVGLLKALVWPAFLVYEMLRFLNL